MPLPPPLFLRADEAAKELGVDFDRLASFSMKNLLTVSVLLARQDPIYGVRDLDPSPALGSIHQLPVNLTGIFDLDPQDAFVTLISGATVIHYVRDSKTDTPIRITSPVGGILIVRGDVVIRTEEQGHFKRTHLGAETKRQAGPGRPSIHAWNLCFAELTEQCGPEGLPRDPKVLQDMVKDWFQNHPGSADRMPDDSQIRRKVKQYLASMEADEDPLAVTPRSKPIGIKMKKRRR